MAEEAVSKTEELARKKAGFDNDIYKMMLQMDQDCLGKLGDAGLDFGIYL